LNLTITDRTPDSLYAHERLEAGIIGVRPAALQALLRAERQRLSAEAAQNADNDTLGESKRRLEAGSPPV